MTYASQIWGQNINQHVRRISQLQNKALRIIKFANYHEPASHLYKNSKILKFKDNITLHNFTFVYDSFSKHNQIPGNLKNKFSYIHSRHDHLTRNSKMNCVNLPISKTVTYGINSITGQSARNWNSLQVTLFKGAQGNFKLTLV